MELFGFLLFLTGASCLDTEGKMWYVAAAITMLGLIISYVSAKRNGNAD